MLKPQMRLMMAATGHTVEAVEADEGLTEEQRRALMRSNELLRAMVEEAG